MGDDGTGVELPFKDANIGPRTYRAYILPLERWAELTEYIATHIGGTVADMLRGYQAGDVAALLDIDVGVAADSISKLVKGMSAKQLLMFVDYAGGSLAVDDGKGLRRLNPEQQRAWWPYHMREMAPAMALFLKAQYADFFGGVGSLLPERPSGPDSLEESTTLDPSWSLNT